MDDGTLERPSRPQQHASTVEASSAVHAAVTVDTRAPAATGIQHVDIDAEPEAGARAPHRFWIHRRERDGAVGMPSLVPSANPVPMKHY